MAFKDIRFDKYDVDFDDRRELIGSPTDASPISSGAMSSSDKAEFDRRLAVATYASDQTIPDTVYVVRIDATSNDVTLTLPEANTAGPGRSHSLVVKRIDESSHNAAIQRSGSDTIEGESAIYIGCGWSLPLESDGSTSWSIA